MPKLEPGKKAPGIVLVHGGGGTAFDAWVRLWVSRGYAAIAMDTCGCVPKGSYGKWQRHDAGGPPGWGGFDQADEPMADQWPYHAVADVILAHSVLRGMPEVDQDRIGITGISWGGYLTCIVSGLDDRFRFAAPVYGCGYLGDDSVWVPEFKKLGARGDRWLAMWDPSHYLKNGKMPKLWVTGTNDFAYPMDSLQKSYRLAGGVNTLCIRLRMPHGHGGAGENPAEILAFANAIVGQGARLATIEKQGRDGEKVWARFQSDAPIVKAELLYTEDEGAWPARRWQTAPAGVDQTAKTATATLPSQAKVYFLNLIDDRNLIVSSEHEETTSKNTAKVFVGYLYGRPRHINFRLYTHLCHAFLVADEEGNVRKDRNVPSRELTAKAHKAGVKVLLSLGGWGWDKQFAAIVSKPDADDRYVKSVMAIVKDNDYDGIDLDWEYPDTEQEVVGFERLIRRFRKAIDEIGSARGRPMASRWPPRATPARSSGSQGFPAGDHGLDQRDDLRLHRRLDELCRPPFAAFRLVEAARRPRSTALSMKYLLEERACPRTGWRWAFPLYGRGFSVAEPYASTKDAPRARVPGAITTTCTSSQDEKGWTRNWDDETKNPWLLAPNHDMRDRLRRRRIGRDQDRVGHEARVPRRLLLADRRRFDARQFQPPAGSRAGEAGRAVTTHAGSANQTRRLMRPGR